MVSAVSKISDFLAEAGLSDLLDRFVDEDIDMAVLPLLDKDDLKDLGLTLGQRKKLLAALDAITTSAAPATFAPPKEAPIQLRRISVMFCDIVGSTELSERLNIEEMQIVLQHYYNIANGIALKRNGYVVGTQGDGVVILFGYPTVLDGFAERCVGAAQELQTALAEKPVSLEGNDPIYIATRIGIATGQAAVGQADNVLPGNPMQLVGPVVNRASRLQTVAHPLSIAVDLKTQELTRSAFQYSDFEKHDLKGLPAGIEVFHLQGLFQSDDTHSAPITMIARTAETAALRRLWTTAQTGTMITATITGDAGIGKSSLIKSFISEHSGPEVRVLQLNCTAMAARSPLRPVAKLLASLKGGDGAVATSIETVLNNPSPELVALTLQFLGLGDKPQSVTPITMSDRDKVLDFLSHWIIKGSSYPTLLVLEDAQWVDDTTRELLKRVASRARTEGAALFLVSIIRDDSEDIWAEQDGHFVLTLPPLSAENSAQLLQSVFGRRPVAQSIRDNILKHSGGNPLMLATLGQAQLEQNLALVTDAVEVPHTIYESVSKRLDKIQLGRSVIEALAVLNRPASPSLVAELLEHEFDDMTSAIDALEHAGLLLRDTLDGQEVISIRHQVYRDVIYEQIVGQSRRRLHAAAYDALDASDAEIAIRRPDILAAHADIARNWQHASGHALTAGEALLKQSALIEAGHFLDMANAALLRLPTSNSVNQDRLRAITGLASVERSRFGISTDTSGALGQQAVALARELGDSQTELLALNGLYAHALVRADYVLAEEYATSLVRSAEQYQNKTFVMIGTRAIGAVAFHRGDMDTALLNLSSALEQYDKDTHLSLAHAHGYDHAEICAAFLSMSHWMQGDLKQSRYFGTFSIDHSREIDHAHSLAQAMAFRMMFGALARDGSELDTIGAEAAELGEKFDIRVMRAAALLFPFATKFCLRTDPPKPAEITKLNNRVKEFRAVNPFNYGPLLATILADVYLRAGDVAAADAALITGVETEATTQETWTAPELMRMRALVTAHSGDRTTAQHQRADALACAEKLGAWTLALRISCDIVEDNSCPATMQMLQDALARMASDDHGWDMTRADALLQIERRA